MKTLRDSLPSRTPLVSFILRYTGNHEDARYLAQETFVRVFDYRHGYEPRGKYSAWRFTIATNLCHNQTRWRQRHPTVTLYDPTEPDGANLEDTILALGDTPADTAECSDMAGAVRQHIQTSLTTSRARCCSSSIKTLATRKSLPRSAVPPRPSKLASTVRRPYCARN